MLRERHERRSGAVVGEQRCVVDAPREVNRTAEAETLDERDDARVELRLIAERADKDELRFGVDAAPEVRQHSHEIVLPFIR